MFIYDRNKFGYRRYQSERRFQGNQYITPEPRWTLTYQFMILIKVLCDRVTQIIINLGIVVARWVGEAMSAVIAFTRVNPHITGTV